MRHLSALRGGRREGDLHLGRAQDGKGRIPVKEFLTKQGRFAHLKEEHFAHIQKMVDEMWDEWEIPGVAPIKGISKLRV